MRFACGIQRAVLAKTHLQPFSQSILEPSSLQYAFNCGCLLCRYNLNLLLFIVLLQSVAVARAFILRGAYLPVPVGKQASPEHDRNCQHQTCAQHVQPTPQTTLVVARVLSSPLRPRPRWVDPMRGSRRSGMRRPTKCLASACASRSTHSFFLPPSTSNK